MGGESILIVEDVPESLKFAAGVLRGAGYKVQIASSAEQALSALRFLRPELILVDFILPGMNGLELAARVKQDARLRNTLVVALTALAMPDEAERARQAGCVGYLTKPIDARTLAASVREYLDLGKDAPFTPAAAAAVRTARLEVPTADSIAGIPEAELAELRDSFLKGGRGLSRQMLANLDGQFDEAKVQRTVHQWTGTAGLLGFPAISRLAREVETVLRTPPWTAARLRGPVTNLARAFHNPTAAVSEPPSPSVERELAGNRVALIGLSGDEAERMCTALEQVGAKPRLFEADQSPYVEAVGHCHVVVVHARPGAVGCRWLAPSTVVLPALPTIFTGQAEHLLSLEPEVLARARGLLMEGSLAEEALMRLRVAVSHAAPAVPRAAAAEGGELVIADSDESSRALLQTRLKEHGLPCRLAANGPDTLVLLRHLRPPAAVLDATMDGCEVLAAIRAESMPVRTILLLPQHQEAEILRGFSLGAGDYLVQPFSALELVARLKRLLA
jgi:CheY-like chemotaxis protein/HPt (histidine-containing phosphotransfer) domain-containing protein